MLGAAIDAFGLLMEPLRLLALFAGMAGGLVFGLLPGLGGVAAASILLPFVYALDAYAGLAMLLGALSVVYTSDTITSVLVGTPGSPASAPTAIEGYALAKSGRAAEAMGVAFIASAIGGIIGVILLTLAIPIAQPLVLLLGTAELFMLALVGLFYASSLVGGSRVKGLASGALGLALGTIGPATAAAEFRFTFGQVYLLDGLSLVVLALGIFGVAEVISMLALGGGIAREPVKLVGWQDGFRDALQHRWLILRGSLIGVIGGIIPAVGATASTWVAYSHAVRSAKDRSRFGHGDVRGIAAAEGANNATVVADLVPTMLFNVPGGPAAAIFMGALYAYGYYPGPRFVVDHADVMFVIIWSCAIGSVLGAVICFFLTPWIARITAIRFAIVAAPLLLVMILGSFQTTNHIGDLFVLFLLGFLGWLMKRGGWPRAPALVGFVLAKPMEQNFWLAIQLHGWSWLVHLPVLVISLLIVVPLAVQLARWLLRHKKEKAVSTAAASANTEPPAKQEETAVTISLPLSALLTIVFAYALVQALGFLPDARLLPLLAIVPGLLLACMALAQDSLQFWGRRAALKIGEEIGAELIQFGFLALYIASIWMFGFAPATAVYLLGILLGLARMRPIGATIYGAILLAGAYELALLMNMHLPAGLLF
ncbi:MAG TPA: tripartite tricarboxylate transporter permease [Candidatus Binatia bacterium]|nr:tripartite tricarboxylate transporter permease [Candidatus Binatia bacterium]